MIAVDEVPEPVLDRAARGYRSTLVSQALRVACKAVSVVVLARLVSPAEHGVFAMAASLTLVLVLFRDFGLGAAAVQAPELSEEQKTTLWHAHAAIGVGLTVLTAALAPAVARFYGEPRVSPVLWAMSGSMLLIGLHAWPRVLLARELRFAELNRLETLAAVIGTGAMIVAGALGAGAFAFVAFLLVSEMVILVESWRVCRWRPRAPGRWASLRGLWRHGADLTGYNVLGYFLQQLDTLLMGRWFGAYSLGLYTRPGQLLVLANTHVSAPLNQVLLATLARLGRASPDFTRHVRETANLLAHLTLPLAAACAVAPDLIVVAVLGHGWPEAAPLLRWLAVSAALSYLTAIVYPLCVATGHTRRLALMAAAALPVIWIGLWLGRAHGPAGLAAGVALANLALLAPRLAWAVHGTPVKLRDLAAAFFGPLALAVALGAGMAGARWALGASTHVTAPTALLIIALGGGAVAALALSAAWGGLRGELRHVWRLRPGAHRVAATRSAP